MNTNKRILEQIESLTNEVKLISNQIEIDRAETSEEESTIRQELLDKQSIIERQLADLKEILHTDLSGAESKHIGQSYTVDIKGQHKNFTIVRATQSDPSNGLISTDSPIAQAIINRSASDQIIVNTPSGNVQYKLVS